jgi:hypothetical protein
LRALKGDHAGTAANNPQCKMFSKAEAGQYIGQVVDHVENAAVGTGCQWSSSGKDGSVLVQVVPARYHEKPSPPLPPVTKNYPTWEHRLSLFRS